MIPCSDSASLIPRKCSLASRASAPHFTTMAPRRPARTFSSAHGTMSKVPHLKNSSNECLITRRGTKTHHLSTSGSLLMPFFRPPANTLTPISLACVRTLSGRRGPKSFPEAVGFPRTKNRVCKPKSVRGRAPSPPRNQRSGNASRLDRR